MSKVNWVVKPKKRKTVVFTNKKVETAAVQPPEKAEKRNKNIKKNSKKNGKKNK